MNCDTLVFEEEEEEQGGEGKGRGGGGGKGSTKATGIDEFR